MDISVEQKTTTQEEERDLLQEALKNYDPDAPPSKTELDRIKKNQANAEYYKSNKEKVITARKERKAAIARGQCIKQGIPEYYAECIQFRADGKAYLVFDSVYELKKVLHWTKFKSRFGEEILK